jgi:hypothetical protein
MAEAFTKKVYKCQVVHPLETVGKITRRLRVINIQMIAGNMQPGTTYEPNNPRDLPDDAEVNVTLTTTQSGHDLMDHFGFEEVK